MQYRKNKKYNNKNISIMEFNPLDLIGPGTIGKGLKGLEKLGVGDFGELASELEQFSNGPLWTKHRIDNAQDKISDMWDDHKDDVEDFFDNVGDTISDTWDAITDGAGDILEAAGDFLDSLL